MTYEKYEKTETHFWVVDLELKIDLKGELGECEKDYFPDGALCCELYLKQDVLHGPSTYYDPTGQVLSVTWYVEGSKVGKVRRYFPNGKLYSLERFVEGKMHLAQEYYYLDGSLKTVISYHEGIFDGETKLFWPDGTLKRFVVFSKGEKKSDTLYNEEGNLIGDTEKALS